MNGWNLKTYFTTSVPFEIVSKFPEIVLILGSLYISTGIQNANLGLVSNHKNVCETHTTAITTRLIKKTTTPQSSNGGACRFWMEEEKEEQQCGLKLESIRE